MGIWRTLYREGRIILGFPPPAETPTQLAERVAGELKGELGGKKSAQGEDWFLDSKFQGRELKVLFEAEGRRVVIQLASTLEGGPLFVLVSKDSQREATAPRVKITDSTFAEGDPSETKVMLDLWKALPTGTRGNLTSLVNRVKGELRYEDGLVRLTPETTSLDGPSAKYNVKSLIQTVYNMTVEIEDAWSKL